MLPSITHLLAGLFGGQGTGNLLLIAILGWQINRGLAKSKGIPLVGQVVMDWLSIPRQLRYLAWALIALALAYLIVSVFRRWG